MSLTRPWSALPCALLLLLALPVLSGCWRAPVRRDPLVIRSPQGDRSILVTTGQTLLFDVRDVATGRTLHRQATRAASRLAWSLRWLDNRTVRLESSDIGSYCWQEGADGAWTEIPCPQVLTVQEGMLLRLDGGWEVGLQLVYRGQYTDAAGRGQTGLVARVSVWDGRAPQAETLEVHPGAIITADERYRVVSLKHSRWSAWLPGAAQDYIVIERLPGDPEDVVR